MHLSNNTGVSLPLAVWLASDGYDFKKGTRKAISATSLLKPTRQILLGERLTDEVAQTTDVTDLIASRLGHTIHDGIEKAWKQDYRAAMKALGYPDKLIQRVQINPIPEELTADTIPIYIEQRFERELMGYAITGKFDMIVEGVIQDFKSTSTYAAKGGKDEDYRLQGSIYRWLNPSKVTSDHMMINFVFTDWQKAMARQAALKGTPETYPQQRVMSHRVELMPVPEIEAWITAKLEECEKFANAPEADLPFCEDLWRGDTQWKFYLDPAKANTPGAKSSKNCASFAEARDYQASKGGRGVIVEVPGKVKRCSYCPAFPICSQKDLYEHA